jgi:hypothetical protein
MIDTTTDHETLLRQSYELATEQMAEARKAIDKVMGTNFAFRHPELVGAFMQIAAINLATVINQPRLTFRQLKCS